MPKGHPDKIIEPRFLAQDEASYLYTHGDLWIPRLSRLRIRKQLPEHVLIPVDAPSAKEGRFGQIDQFGYQVGVDIEQVEFKEGLFVHPVRRVEVGEELVDLAVGEDRVVDLLALPGADVADVFGDDFGQISLKALRAKRRECALSWFRGAGARAWRRVPQEAPRGSARA